MFDELKRFCPNFPKCGLRLVFVWEWPVEWPTLDSPLLPAKNKILIHD